MSDLFQTFIGAILPTVLDLMNLAVMAILGWLASLARDRWGVEIQARHREALHSALMSGIEAALARGLGHNAAVSDAIRHAHESTPDAIDVLKPNLKVLQRIAEAKLRMVTGGAGGTLPDTTAG